MASSIVLTRGPLVEDCPTTASVEGTWRAHVEVGGVTLLLTRAECAALAHVLVGASAEIGEKEAAHARG